MWGRKSLGGKVSVDVTYVKKKNNNFFTYEITLVFKFHKNHSNL